MAEQVLSLTDRLTLSTNDGVPLTVRRLCAGDATALQAFNAALLPATRSRFLPHAYDGATVARMLARSESGEDLTLGLFDGNLLAGYFFLWHVLRRVPLLGIGMLDAWHGRGLGRQMMAVLIEQAKARGCEGIELTTVQDNHAAFALYRKTGFVYCGDVENRSGDGRIVVERAMFLALKPGARRMDGPHAPPV